MNDQEAAAKILELLKDNDNPVRLRCGNFRRLYWDRGEWVVEGNYIGQKSIYRGEYLWVALRKLRE